MMKKIKPKKMDTHLSMSEEPEKENYPTFRIDLEHLPEAKKWEVGKEYVITLKLKMTGISISKFQNDSQYDIIGIEVKGEDEETE